MCFIVCFNIIFALLFNEYNHVLQVFFFNETGTFSLTPPTPSFPVQSHSTGLCMLMVYLCLSYPQMGFSGGSDGKEFSCNVRDLGLITGLGRSPGEGKGTYSSILAGRIPWTHGVIKSDTTELLSPSPPTGEVNCIPAGYLSD